MVTEDRCWICKKGCSGNNYLTNRDEAFLFCEFHYIGVRNFMESVNRRTKKETIELNQKDVF